MSTLTLAARPRVLVDLIPGGRVRDVAAVLSAAGLTGLCAQISIHTPLSPVPFTLQTFAVLLAGAVLGSARSGLGMALYLLAGGLGLPWFAHAGSGWGGPSFGYLIGFVLAAGAVGRLSERRADRHLLSTAGQFVFGSVIVYAVGAGWLAADLHLSLGQAIDLGVRPFLATDLIKAALAALVLPSTWALLERR
ncbi:MAG TPA: biotin transporter BioY [Jatrophihabitans sp.]|nr:biotin transporter BioY [Jatrophihabitans sp.]